MSKRIALALSLLAFFGTQNLLAQTLEQDRRIEEGKRHQLKPTVTPTGTAVPTKESKTLGSPPVPQPIKEIYFILLIPKRITYGYDAAKGIVILMGVDEETIDLGSQVAYLKEKGFLPGPLKETFDPMQPLRKGVAACIFQRALGIRGGIALHLFRSSQRYALKELAFQGIMSPGHVNDLVSGAELVQMMDQAARYKLAKEAPQSGTSLDEDVKEGLATKE